MLSEREKHELRVMGASAELREDFRAMRRNSEAIERTISVDELAHWLSVMARLHSPESMPRQSLELTHAQL